MKPIEIIEKYYDKNSPAYHFLVVHGEMVARKALKIAENVPELNPDLKLIESGAMLHDIGIFLTNAQGIGCFGKEPYIMHGILGAEILRKESLPKNALICEKHLGVGIAKEEILHRNLPLPKHDFIPETTEEEIVSLADKFYSKIESKETQEKTIGQIKKELALYPGSVERFERWLKKYKIKKGTKMSDEKDEKCCGHCSCGKNEEKELEKCACGMPLDAQTSCKCEPTVCIHCCNCPDGGQECGCFCAKKSAADNEDEPSDDE